MFLHGFCFNKFSNKKGFSGVRASFLPRVFKTTKKRWCTPVLITAFREARFFRQGFVGLSTFLHNPYTRHEFVGLSTFLHNPYTRHELVGLSTFLHNLLVGRFNRIALFFIWIICISCLYEMSYKLRACSEQKSLAQFFRKDKKETMDDNQFCPVLDRFGFSCSVYSKFR